ncbi:MAG: hypothetical protein JWQ90_5492 [Hydrocarboniphaga sp.]|uniref:HupE/UreJ family protein n=1 Tax=Hydrocarboniphaga sp. TaxID=2033016 RepID=UPI00260792D1|nr:HupE/UreJ family protein [Hydrocarboniphaga sp.]MDB5973042.1 hypothetical protein [Hydrocarboniphaga sp.]
MRLRAACAAMLLLLCAGVPHPVLAHDVPPSIVMLDIGRNAIDVELQLPVSELGAALLLPLASIPGSVVAQHGPRIERYIGDRLLIRSQDGRSYALHIESLAMKATDNVNWTSNDWLSVQARLQAPAGVSTEVFALDYEVILQQVVSHQALIYVRRDIRNGLLGDKPMLISTAGFGNTHIQVDGSDGSWWQGFRHMFSLGLHHIAEGPDHLLFLLALLLPSPLIASAGRWRARKSLAASARTIVGVVSGFTVGHSISLALAAMGWVVAPTRIIEILIAVSILVSCAHAWRPLFAGKEIWIASAFGLVHGLAFAEVLAGLNFDGATLALSLVGFNLGIEAMQLLVITATLPLILLLSTTRAYAVIRVAGAAFAAACALGWILERALGRANPLQLVADWMAPPPLWFAVTVCLASTAALCVLAGLVLRQSRGAHRLSGPFHKYRPV